MLSGSSCIYLDYAATTPTRPEVVEVMMPLFNLDFGNPPSLHRMGRQAKKHLESARSGLARSIRAQQPEDFIFTSGGTESNNLAIKGVAFGLKDKGKHLVTSQIEHSSVLEVFWWLEKQGWEITLLPVDAEGGISPGDLENAIRPDTVLVSLMHGNNEVGTLQPVAELGHVARRHGVLFHTDAVQTVGKLPIDLQELPVDMLSASAHKFYGPKGTGFLYVNNQARSVLTPLLHGGGQEWGYRSGTCNLPAIVGMAHALKLAREEMDQVIPRERQLQEQLIEGMLQRAPTARLNGPREVSRRVPGHANFSFSPIEGEALILRLDAKGIYASSGSACHGAQITGSHVVQALGVGEEAAKSTVRFTLGRESTEQEIDRVLAEMPAVLEQTGYFRHHARLVTLDSQNLLQ